MVGSLNEDLRLRTRTVQAAGETVLGDPDWRLGGEGSDPGDRRRPVRPRHAVIGRLGVDAGGAKFRDAFEAEGIDPAQLSTSTEAATGLALIVLEPVGENPIIVSSGRT